MQKRLLLDQKQIEITIKRLCYQLIQKYLLEILKVPSLRLGNLDVTFYRDDFRRREIIAPSENKIDFIVENLKVVLIDDVFFTGRTIRAGMEALLDFGRPEKVELLTMVDRRYSRHVPIAPDYIGVQVDTITTEKVKFQWKEIDGEDAVWLI
jgi:pyrimidine operon attenuation protein / uracil phosphoribosyltransferase